MIALSKSQKTSLLRLLQNVAGALILLWFAKYLWTNRVLFSTSSNFSATDILLIALLILGTWIATGAQSYVLFRASQSRMGFLECQLLTMASVFGNYLPMRIGSVLKAQYMRSVHSLEYVSFASIFSVRLILTMVSAGVLGLLAVIAISLTGNHVNVELVGILLSFTIAPCLFYLLAPKQIAGDRNGVLWRLINKFSEGFDNLRARPRVAAICLLLICVQYVFLIARFVLVSHLIGQPMSLSAVTIMVSVSTISNFVAITPGGIGVRESVLGYAATSTGASFSQGVILGSVDRVILISMVALLGGASFLYIWLRLDKTKTKTLSH